MIHFYTVAVNSLTARAVGVAAVVGFLVGLAIQGPLVAVIYGGMAAIFTDAWAFKLNQND